MSEEKLKERLLPCPFCGGKAQISSDGGCKEFVVFCNGRDCGASVKNYEWGKISEQKAIKQWNTRQSSEAVSDAVELIDDIIVDSYAWLDAGSEFINCRDLLGKLSKIKSTINQPTTKRN